MGSTPISKEERVPRRPGRPGNTEREGQVGSATSTASAPVAVDALLLEPTPRAARAIALQLLEEVELRFGRLDNSRDPEALHDFRVALRRLRSWLRAYHKDLRDSVGKKATRRLAAIADATTDSRDIEVHLEWVVAQRSGTNREIDAGVRWLQRELKAEKTRADAALRASLAESFARMAAQLRKNLSRYAVAVWDQDRGDRWAMTAAARTQDAFTAFRTALEDVESVDDDAAAHRARIAGKRLRYLLEPLAPGIEEVAPCVAALKRVQDLLGSMHDAYVFGRTIRRLSRSRAAGRARSSGKRGRASSARDAAARAGMRQLANRLVARRDAAWEEFTTGWHDGEFAALSAATHAVVRRLREVGGAGVEIERKYLLRRLPSEARAAPAVKLDQGYLPGTQLVERIRREKSSAGVRYLRTVKMGAGLVRTELEETCTYTVYKALWPLTKGKRIRKTRYRLADAEHVWEIDEFADRSLILAEVELHSSKDDVRIPDWLSRLIVREVTGEPEYANVNLAR